MSYESAGFWVALVALIVAFVSLYLAKVGVDVAKSSLTLAEDVARREQRDWVQRKWFDLYFEAVQFENRLEHFRTIYDRVLATEEFEKAANELAFSARRLLAYASVFPQNPAIDYLFACINKWPLEGENLFSKQMLEDYENAIEELRQHARVESTVLTES
jgi:hypothetical protein